jgi:hypothetical protein
MRSTSLFEETAPEGICRCGPSAFHGASTQAETASRLLHCKTPSRRRQAAVIYPGFKFLVQECRSESAGWRALFRICVALDPRTQNLFLVTSDFTLPSEPNGARKAIKGTARLLVYGR